jgi:hypothetical protein
MLLSDAIGILASILLMIPAAKDNVYRFVEAQHKRKAQRSPWPGLQTFIIDAWKLRRDEYSPWDSLWMLLGGLLLAGSFVLKLLER